jgi:hypothetical protein
VILPDAAPHQRHREDITRTADALPVRRRGQVVVTVPARLLSRIGDQLEDPFRRGRDLPAGTDHALLFLTGCHAAIQQRSLPSWPT